MSDDGDLHRLREFVHGRSTPAPGALARVQRRVEQAASPTTRPRRRLPRGAAGSPPRWVAPAATAAVVLAVVGGIAALGSVEGAAPTAAPSGAPTVVATGAPWPVYRAAVPVADVFEQLARAAGGTAPLAPQPGELLCTRTDVRQVNTPAGVVMQPSSQVREVCAEPVGLLPVRETWDGVETGGVKGETSAELLAIARETFVEVGPGWGYPTTAWLSGLPTDPETLRAAFHAGSRGPADVDPLERWHRYGDFLGRVEPLLPAPQRVAFHRVMAGVGGLTATEVDLAGRRLYAVRQGNGINALDLLFDPATGRITGQVEVSLSTVAPTPGGGHPPSAPSGVPSPVRQELWTYSLQPAPR
ncbi:hypothetical protein [Catellatospora methionotrophica]|uniref:hypothetical protein n=1 Tax=Catellatospora methionotrophica TaxID=121620 RepID=UPI00340CA5E7